MADFRQLNKRERAALLRDHRGILSRAAEIANVTRGQVSRVFWGYTKVSPIVADAINVAIDIELSKDRHEG
jgi:hypothetical protein